jgi:myo-inositol-1(or 4)-monophosphatase
LTINNRKQFIQEVLLEAGKLLIEKYPTTATYSGAKGYLAEADLLMNEFIKTKIRSEYSNEQIFSEEDDESQRPEVSDSSLTWIIDPICGTTNFVKKLPFFVISLCVLDSAGVLSSGIFDPLRDELFLADRESTSLNGTQIFVSDVETLDEAIIAVNCNQSSFKRDRLLLIDHVIDLAPPKTRRLRIMESANLELAYVACGRLDGYLNHEDKIWDMAAGSLMIQSAGGVYKILNGSFANLKSCLGIVTSNENIFRSLAGYAKDISEVS